MWKDVTFVQFLIATRGSTPLHLVLFVDDPTVCQLLLDAGADILALNEAGQTPLQFVRYMVGSKQKRVCAPLVAILEEAERAERVRRAATDASPSARRAMCGGCCWGGEREAAMPSLDPNAN
jgi:hypothetical protein